jgi:hypothetical protein
MNFYNIFIKKYMNLFNKNKEKSNLHFVYKFNLGRILLNIIWFILLITDLVDLTYNTTFIIL